ncbi:hypothetical protein [Ottowia thiooxydans]|uniref:hypothetical protein n=1 Tax=Ottowia thiooxydans TaxID=219182 RepID=UPI00041E5C9B|nr:hypothetical protein [Ottowia thiooxydans]
MIEYLLSFIRYSAPANFEKSEDKNIKKSLGNTGEDFPKYLDDDVESGDCFAYFRGSRSNHAVENSWASPDAEKFMKERIDDPFSDENYMEEAIDDPFSNTDRKSIDESIEKSFSNTDKKSIDENIEKPLNNTDEKSTDETSKKPFSTTDKKSIDESIEKSLNNTDEKSTDETSKKPFSNTDKKSIDESIEKSLNYTDDKSIDESIEKPLNNTDKKSTDETIKKPLNKKGEEVFGVSFLNDDRLESTNCFSHLYEWISSDSVEDPHLKSMKESIKEPSDMVEADSKALVTGALKKDADQALKDARSLCGEIDKKFRIMNEQVRRLGNLPVIEPELGRSDDVELSTMEHVNRYFHVLKGVVHSFTDTLGVGVTAIALPTVANVFLGGIVSTSVGYGMSAITSGTGAYLLLSTLRDAPQLASDHATVSLINSGLKDIQVQQAQLQKLLEDEQRRQKTLERSALVSISRHEGIQALELELDQVSVALQIAERSSEYSVALGDGRASKLLLSLVESIRLGFNFIFGPIIQGWSSVSRLFATLPNAYERGSERRQAVSQERTEKAAYRWALDAISERSETSLLEPGDDVHASNLKGCTETEKNKRTEESRQKLNMGENLMRLIRDGQASPDGIVMIETKGERPIQYSVPSNVTLARALTFYFSVIADKSNADPDAGVHKDAENGSLVVTDPKGSFYSFLMHVPSAYTASMVGLKSAGAHGRLTIDDHAAGFPGGACSMQFEQRLNKDGVLELRVNFLSEQAKPVFLPLENESRVLRSLYIAMHERRAEQTVDVFTAPILKENTASLTDYSDWSIGRMRDHQIDLVEKLDNEVSLLQIESQRYQAVHQWERPAY